MYALAEICVRRPVFALMLITALVVAGLASYPRLGVDRFPNIDMAQVTVRTDYPGAAASEVESEVTAIIEDAVATVAGIDELRSISWDAQSLVMVTFQLDRDTSAGSQDIRDAVSAVIRRLPRGIDPPVVQKRDIDSSPILTLAVAGPRTSRELYLLADHFVKNTIESAKGVGQVVIAGSADRAVQINVSADRLAANQLSILEVRDAVARQNAEIPGGRLDQGMKERIIRTQGRLDESRQFEDLVVATRGETTIRLGDIAEVRDGTKEVRTLARLDGQPAVVLQVQRQSGENTVEVIDQIKSLLPKAQTLLPDDVRVTVVQDQSRYIRAALNEIEHHLISGSILACLTVLLFMRSWRSTVIASVAIPTSIIATFAFMNAFGFTLNNVTMLALVLMVGVVIDDAIVVLENVFFHIEEKGMSPFDAAIVGTKEIGPAVLATTLSLVIVFLPVSFLSSVTGRMLFQFGITATVAILVSMLVSFTLTPMMCSKMLRPITRKENADGSAGGVASRGGFYGWVETAYLAILRLALRFRWGVLALVVMTCLSNFWLQSWVQRDYVPLNVDESEFEVRVEAPRGATIRAMRQTIDAVEAELKGIDGIEKVVTTVGSGGFGDVNRATFFIRLEDSQTRTFSFGRLMNGLLRGDPGEAFRGNYTQREKMAAIRKQLNQLGDLQISVRNLTSLRQGSNADVDFSITGPNLEQLIDYSDRLLAKAKTLAPVADTYSTLVIDNPELLVSINRERAAALGVDVTEIAETLRIAVGGDDRVSRYHDAQVDDAYDVEVRLVGLDRANINSISQLYVRTTAVPTSDDFRSAQTTTYVSAPGMDNLAKEISAAGHTRIDNLVDFSFGRNASRIDRLGRQKMVSIRGNIAVGYGLTDGLDAMWGAIRELGIPPELDVQVLGGGRELDRTMLDFRWTFLMSIIFMYIVLAAQYEHLVYPLIILLSLPLAVPFGLLSLYWGGETLNLYSAMGVLVLFGVVKKAAILQVDHTNVLRRRGMERNQAILQANRDRLRPILMTTISFVAGLLPLLIATGPGAEERRSIAVLVVGGQTLSLLLTLIAIPVLYTFFDDLTALVWKPAQVPTPDSTPASVHAGPAEAQAV